MARKSKDEKRIDTLERAVDALQQKIKQQIPTYKELQLAQEARTTKGDMMLKNNPAMMEFRNMVTDYAKVLKVLQEIKGAESEKKSDNVISLVGNSKWKKQA